jgi:hypothetical protein
VELDNQAHEFRGEEIAPGVGGSPGRRERHPHCREEIRPDDRCLGSSPAHECPTHQVRPGRPDGHGSHHRCAGRCGLVLVAPTSSRFDRIRGRRRLHPAEAGRDAPPTCQALPQTSSRRHAKAYSLSTARPWGARRHLQRRPKATATGRRSADRHTQHLQPPPSTPSATGSSALAFSTASTCAGRGVGRRPSVRVPPESMARGRDCAGGTAVSRASQRRITDPSRNSPTRDLQPDAHARTRPPAHPRSDALALTEQGPVEGSRHSGRAPSSWFIDWPHLGV